MITSITKAQGYCGIDLTCELTSAHIDGEDEISYTTYGIRVVDRGGNTVVHHPDVSTDRQLVESVISLCESCGVSAIHIMDILEDCLV